MELETFSPSTKAAAPPDVDKPEASQHETIVLESIADNSSMTKADLLHVFSKWQIVATWAGLLLMVLINYLNTSTQFTFSVYALSDFSQAAAEGTLNTIFGIVALAVQIPMAMAVNHFSDFDVLIVVTLLSVLATAVEASAPSFGGFVAGFSLNIVAGMSGRFLSYYLAAKLSSLRYRTLALNLSQIPMFISLLAASDLAESILEHLGWRWGYGLFCIIIPASCVLLLAMLFISRRRAARLAPGEASRSTAFRKEFKEQDWLGLFLLVAGCALLLLPVPLETRGVEFYDTAAVIAPIAIGAVVLVVFVVWEAWVAKNPFLNPRILRNKTVVGCMATTIFCYASQQFSIVYIYTWISVASNVSISEASYISLAGGIVSAVFGLVCGAWISWAKRGKWPLVICNCVAVLGNVLQYIFIDPQKHKAAVIVAQVLMGVGWSGNATALAIAQAITSRDDMPVLTALSFIMSNFGGGFASCMSGGLWTSFLLKYLKEDLPTALKSEAADIMGSVVSATDFDWGSPERDAIAAAYRASYRIQALGSLIAGIISLLFCFLIKNVVLETEIADQIEEEDSKVPESILASEERKGEYMA